MSADRVSERFPPSRRLHRRSEFQVVQRLGRRFTNGHFALLWQPRSRGNPRLGITVSRKVGDAVVRNRLRRRVREIYRRHLPALPPGSIVLIARPSAASLSFDALRDGLRALFERATRSQS